MIFNWAKKSFPEIMGALAGAVIAALEIWIYYSILK